MKGAGPCHCRARSEHATTGLPSTIWSSAIPRRCGSRGGTWLHGAGTGAPALSRSPKAGRASSFPCRRRLRSWDSRRCRAPRRSLLGSLTAPSLLLPGGEIRSGWTQGSWSPGCAFAACDYHFHRSFQLIDDDRNPRDSEIPGHHDIIPRFCALPWMISATTASGRSTWTTAPG